MKTTRLFVLAFGLCAFTFMSCGDEDDSNLCTRCKLSIPLIADCEIDVCEDGTSTIVGGETLSWMMM